MQKTSQFHPQLRTMSNLSLAHTDTGLSCTGPRRKLRQTEYFPRGLLEVYQECERKYTDLDSSVLNKWFLRRISNAVPGRQIKPGIGFTSTKVHLAKKRHQKTRLSRASRSDDKVDLSLFEKEFAINPEYELAFGGCQRPIGICRPREASVSETDTSGVFGGSIEQMNILVLRELVEKLCLLQKRGNSVQRDFCSNGLADRRSVACDWLWWSD